MEPSVQVVLTPEQVLVVTGLAVGVVELIKRFGGVAARFAPLLVLGVSMVAVVLYTLREGIAIDGPSLFDLFSAWILVATSTAGAYGLAKAGTEAVQSKLGKPPDGDSPGG